MLPLDSVTRSPIKSRDEDGHYIAGNMLLGDRVVLVLSGTMHWVIKGNARWMQTFYLSVSGIEGVLTWFELLMEKAKEKWGGKGRRQGFTTVAAVNEMVGRVQDETPLLPCSLLKCLPLSIVPSPNQHEWMNDDDIPFFYLILHIMMIKMPSSSHQWNNHRDPCWQVIRIHRQWKVFGKSRISKSRVDNEYGRLTKSCCWGCWILIGTGS